MVNYSYYVFSFTKCVEEEKILPCRYREARVVKKNYIFIVKKIFFGQIYFFSFLMVTVMQ